MKLIIDIPEQMYINAKADTLCGADTLVNAIKNGTPLPKGHGRLKDVDWIDDNCPDYRTEDGAWCYKWEDIDNAPTIIEADNEGVEPHECSTCKFGKNYTNGYDTTTMDDECGGCCSWNDKWQPKEESEE